MSDQIGAASPAISGVGRWLAVVTLGIGTSTIVSTEFAPMGLISAIAADLDSRPAEVGLVVTAYAWIGAVSALLSAVLPVRFPRKLMLVALMLVLAGSNGLAMIAQSFQALLAARLVGALSHGIFWAMVAAVAVQIAPSRHMGLATSIVFGGVSIASVLGLPLVNLVGEIWGWRFAFGGLAVLGIVTALLTGVVLPPVTAAGVVGRAALTSVVRNGKLWRAYLVAIFAVTAHFGAFTFIEPYLRQIPDIAPSAISTLLLSFGAAGLAGNVVTGLLIDRLMRAVIVFALLLMCLALLGLGFLGSGFLGPNLGMPAVFPLLLIWGGAIAALFVGLQAWVLRAAGTAAMPAAALYTTIFNSALGIGAMLEALILDAFGLSAVMVSAGLAVALAIALFLSTQRDREAWG
jgi:predicted MFS family arabinose efflux permease